MSQFFASPARRRLGLATIGVVGAASMFVSGLLVARATMEDEPAPSDSSRQAMDIGTARGEMPAVGLANPANGGASDSARTMEIRMACQAPIGNGAFDGGVIDPAKLGFEVNLPSEGFTLESMSFRSEGDCDDQGQAISGSGKLVLDTRWVHDETGLTAWVSQRADGEQIANVMGLTNGSFWLDGYAYQVGVDMYHTLMAENRAVDLDTASTPPQREPAADLPVSDGGTSAASVGRAALPGSAPGADPRAQEVFRTLVAQLAPDIDEKCFARQRVGDWSDLALMGVDDPRGALPAGYSEQYVDIVVFEPAADDCGGPAFDGSGNSFTANWVNGDNNISVSAYSVTWNDQSAGYASEGAISWTNGAHWFNVHGWGNGGALPEETLRAVAVALDSGLSDRCIVRNHSLTEDEIAALGIRTPVVPDDFSPRGNAFSGTTVEGDCSGATHVSDSFRAAWYFTRDGRAMLEIGVGKAPDGGAIGNIEFPYGFSWTDANGFNYSLHLFKAEGDVDLDELAQIALSLDPTFDRSTLTDGGDGGAGSKPLPMPMPVR